MLALLDLPKSEKQLDSAMKAVQRIASARAKGESTTSPEEDKEVQEAALALARVFQFARKCHRDRRIDMMGDFSEAVELFRYLERNDKGESLPGDVGLIFEYVKDFLTNCSNLMEPTQ